MTFMDGNVLQHKKKVLSTAGKRAKPRETLNGKLVSAGCGQCHAQEPTITPTSFSVGTTGSFS